MNSSHGGLNALLLARFPTLRPLTPTQNNVYAALVTILYVKIVMEIGALIRIKYDFAELSRKFIHLCACSLIVFWPLFDADHWGWRLNVTVPVVMSVRLLYKVRSRFFLFSPTLRVYSAFDTDVALRPNKGAVLKDPEDEDVRLMSRTSSPSELLYGPLQMTLVMTYVGLNKFTTPDVAVILMASFVGDWMAAMIGIHYGRHKYHVPLGGEKSIEGNVGCVVGTIFGICFYSYMLGIEIVRWELLVAYGVVSSAAEATAIHNWDNLVLVIAMEISSKHLPQMIK